MYPVKRAEKMRLMGQYSNGTTTIAMYADMDSGFWPVSDLLAAPFDGSSLQIRECRSYRKSFASWWVPLVAGLRSRSIF